MSQENLSCPRCGLALPGGTTFCPECGKDFADTIKQRPTKLHSNNDRRQANIITAAVASGALAFGIVTFQVGYTAVFLAFIVPAVAFLLVYAWERNRGIKPGWEFIALSVVGTYAGGIFGWFWVLIPIAIYFFAFRYWLERKEPR